MSTRVQYLLWITEDAIYHKCCYRGAFEPFALNMALWNNILRI